MASEHLAQQMVGRLSRDRDALTKAWGAPAGTTTRHLVVDDLLDAATAAGAFEAFESDRRSFIERKSFREKKRTWKVLAEVQPLLGDITRAMQDQSVVDAIAAITGISDLRPDPTLYAGGLSVMEEGDFLNPHIDNSHDADRAVYRRLNLLYYVTPNWRSADGGNFELWDHSVRRPVEIVSTANRLVVMETTRTSYHSVNRVRSDRARCCLSNYYFSAESPEPGSDYFHVTTFKGRPERKLNRLLSAADGAARNAVARRTSVGRGKKQRNRTSPGN